MSGVTAVFPHDIDSSLTVNEGAALAELSSGKVVLELGAWLGRSTVCIAQTAAKCYSVDWHQGDAHAGGAHTLVPYLRNLRRYGLEDKVVVIIGRFEDVLPALAPFFFDLVFLDGFHTYDQVKRDAEQAIKLVNGHGTIAFHDYGVEASSMGGGEFGVTKAVDAMFERPTRLVDSLAIVEV